MTHQTEAMKSALCVLCAAEKANDWHPNMAKDFAFAIEALRAALSSQPPAPTWQPIETAPKGSGMDGPGCVTDAGYVKPPELLLATEEGLSVAYYDWYYHEGYGQGAEPDVPAWRERGSGEPVYGATHWMPLPAAPASLTAAAGSTP